MNCGCVCIYIYIILVWLSETKIKSADTFVINKANAGQAGMVAAAAGSLGFSSEIKQAAIKTVFDVDSVSNFL